MCFKCCSASQCKNWIFSFGTFFLVIGIVTVVLWPILLDRLVQHGLKEGTELYSVWVEPPIPIYMDFYLFNWTNPAEIRNPNVKPAFSQVGPYVFLEKHIKENITFFENNTVAYNEKWTWFFDAERSNGTLDDLITAPDVITATAVNQMRHQSKIIKTAINTVLNVNGGKLYVTKPAREWMFDGVQDDLLDFLRLFKSNDFQIPFKRFGWLVGRNGSSAYNGRFTMQTGTDNISNLGRLTHWNGKVDTGFYKMPCSIVNGSTGDVFPPKMNPEADITIFASEACRFMNLSPNGTIQRHGLTGVRWVGTAETLNSGETYPNQKCFCDTRSAECPKTGVVGCQKCHYNAPIYVSFPHFYAADASYVNAIEGMAPQEAKHQFSLAVEPVTGITLEARGRLQVNMLIEPDDDFDIYHGLPKFMLPVFWFDRHVELSAEFASRAELALNLSSYGAYMGIGIIIIGSVCILIGIILMICRSSDRSPINKYTSVETTPMFHSHKELYN